MSIIDVSVPLRAEMPVWPGSVGYRRESLMSIADGDPVNVSALHVEVHTGTHIDAPLHFVPGGEATDAIPLDVLVGPAWVVRLDDVDTITAAELEAAEVPFDCTRLLLRTRNSDVRWFAEGVPFREDYAALAEDGAQWIVERGIEVVGIDYLSIQKFTDGPEVHQILLTNRVVIVEGLHLDHVQPGSYEMICLPLLAPGCEGVPARVVLRVP